MARRKVSAVYHDFAKELRLLTRLDAENQAQFGSTDKRRQLLLLTETVFFRAFRAYENFLEDSFVLFTQQKPTFRGGVPKSFLRPQNFNHARELLRSGKPFLDWSSPETVIDRAETFVKNGGTVKTVLVGTKQDLRDMKVIRNHIAHNSRESRAAFNKLLRRARGTSPMQAVEPGDQLLAQVRNDPLRRYYLEYYLNRLAEVAESIVEK